MSQARNAIITGSTSGIGLAIAEAFCAAGMNVMLNGLTGADEAEAIRGRLADLYVGVRTTWSRGPHGLLPRSYPTST